MSIVQDAARRLVKRAGSQKRAAEVVGTSQQTIQRWCDGRVGKAAEIAARLVQIDATRRS